jgi:hypothetical protein
MSTLKVNAILDASGGNTATINSMTPTADSLQGFRNRIINGAMVIDQRNAGASVTPANQAYTLDRWQSQLSQNSKYSIQQVTTASAGFSNSLKVTSLSAYTVGSGDFFAVIQAIEGYNIADLSWGTASAKTVTLSFQVQSSLTGTFGGSIVSGSGSYPFTYTIGSANTWTTISVVISANTTYAPTSTTNGVGIYVCFGLGVGSSISGTAGSWQSGFLESATGAVSVVGTSGATFYITGVQLEVGSVATPFERRDYGRELAMCQRYYWKFSASTNSRYGAGLCYSTTSAVIVAPFPVTMRVGPSALEQTGTATHYRLLNSSGSGVACSSVPTFNTANTSSAEINFTVASGITAGNATLGFSNSTSGYLAWSAEL